jgi:hypothetical protein
MPGCGDMELSTKRKLLVIVIIMIVLALFVLSFLDKMRVQGF